jgi:hypothetical protein
LRQLHYGYGFFTAISYDEAIPLNCMIGQAAVNVAHFPRVWSSCTLSTARAGKSRQSVDIAPWKSILDRRNSLK